MSNIVTQRFIKCHDKLKADGIIRSSRQFALSVDYLPQSLSEILKGRRDATIDLIRKSIDKYKVNPVYLFTGEGPMFMTEEENQDFRTLTIVTTPNEEERIVHVPIPAQAGYASEHTDPSFIQELPSYVLPDYKYKVGTHRSFDMGGDSMEPTLFEGDKVVCSYLEPTLWESGIKDSYVYVIVTRADIMVKRVNNLIKESRKLELVSDNNFYEKHTIRLADIREIWYVRARISPFLPSPRNVKHLVREEVYELRKTMQQQSRLIENLNATITTLVNQRS
ncbi:MAG: peptidase S24 [Bacteroidetes bacterium]|nr:MAG: peptidase S24 [Bacteroidota bacterium]PTM13185.1 MAG: peptidase S24 [Bacteroidota bacterium]